MGTEGGNQREEVRITQMEWETYFTTAEGKEDGGEPLINDEVMIIAGLGLRRHSEFEVIGNRWCCGWSVRGGCGGEIMFVPGGRWWCRGD